MENKEQIRRKKIKASLRKYFKSSEGIIHRKKLSQLQSVRMRNYGKYLQENNISNNNNNNEK